MTPSNDLFELIQSLNKSEQRYVSIALMQNDGNNYSRLFSVIAAQENYDEKQIKQEFKKEAFVKHFAFTKNYLHNLILKLLRNYYSESNINVDLHNKIVDIEVLIEKGFYKQAYTRTKAAVALAKEHELPQVELELLSIVKRFFYRGLYDIDEKELERNEKKLLDKIVNLHVFENINVDVHLKYIHHGLYRKTKPSEDPVKKVERLKIKPQTLTALYHYLTAVTVFYGNNRKFNSEFWKAVKKCELLFVKNPVFAKHKPLFLINAYHTKALTQVLAGKMDEVYSTIETIENLSNVYKFKLTPAVRVKLIEVKISLKFEYYYETRQFDKGVAELPPILEDLRQFGKYIVKREITMIANHTAAMFYFIDRQYKKSIKILHEIINNENKIFARIRNQSKFLIFINHFELQNKEAFNYLIKLYPPETKSIEYQVIYFLRDEIMNEKSKKILKIKWVELKRRIDKHPDLLKLKTYFEADKWVESKIQNISYKEMLTKS